MSQAVVDLLKVRSGGKRFISSGAPVPCKGTFMAIHAVNGDAEFKPGSNCNIKGAEGVLTALAEGETKWVTSTDPILVSGEIWAYDAD